MILDTCWQGYLQKIKSICQVCLHLRLLVNISSTSNSNWSMTKVKGYFRQAVKRAVLSESMMKTNWAEDTTLALMPYFHIPRFHSAALCLCEYWCKYSFSSYCGDSEYIFWFVIVVYYTVNHVVWDYNHSFTTLSCLTYLLTLLTTTLQCSYNNISIECVCVCVWLLVVCVYVFYPILSCDTWFWCPSKLLLSPQ